MFRGIWRKVYTLCTTQRVACSRHVPLPWLLSILHTAPRSGFLLMSPLFLQFSFLFALASESEMRKFCGELHEKERSLTIFKLIAYWHSSMVVVFFLHTLPRNESQVKSAARNQWAIHFPFIFAASICFDKFGRIPSQNFSKGDKWRWWHDW